MQAPCLNLKPRGQGRIGRLPAGHSLRTLPQPSTTQAPEAEVWQPTPQLFQARAGPKTKMLPVIRTATKRRLRMMYLFGQDKIRCGL
jgi:hypothetical protein